MRNSNIFNISLNIKYSENKSFVRGLEKEQMVLLTHGDSIDRVADNFHITARSSNFIAGIASDKMNLYGVQFHPEVDLTPNGKTMLHNFLFGIAGLTGNYTLRGREAQCIQFIRDTVGNKKVLVRKRFTINI